MMQIVIIADNADWTRAPLAGGPAMESQPDRGAKQTKSQNRYLLHL